MTQHGTHKFIDLVESFDSDVLQYIVRNKDLKNKMRVSCFDNKKDPFLMATRYLYQSRKGQICVRYRQNEGFGRYYAVGGVGLQSLPREIRHSIASKYYDDIDISNAHPVILSFLAKARNSVTEFLDSYIANRDQLLSDLSTKNNISIEAAKTVILALINNGNKDYNALRDKPEWLVKFKEEMETIRSKFALGGTYEEHKRRRIKAGVTFNHKASYMNKLLCDFENNILQNMYKSLGSPTNCVLCFDGIMIPKECKYDLREIESHVKAQLGINILLKVKPMNLGFDVPTNILAYNPFPSSFDFADPYDYSKLRSEFIGRQFESRSAMDVALFEKLRKSIAFVLTGGGIFIKKLAGEVDITRSLGATGFTMTYMSDNKEMRIGIQDYVSEQKDAFPAICCSLTNIESKFNLFTGFQASQVELDELDEKTQSGLDLMKSFIRKVWASNNDAHYKYIVSWLAGLFTDGINKTALVMISKQGCGKGTLIEFLELLLKRSNMYVSSGITAVTQKHNTAIQGKRLIVINEMSSTKDEWRSNFDKLKALITDPTVSIEPKGINPYTVDNISNFILMSNHRDSVIVEQSDRRNAVFEMSDAHMNDTDYFGRIRASCFNQDVADAFYSYLLNLEKCGDLVDIFILPDTSLRQK